MATIKLDLQEVKHLEMLPDLCMRCGRPAVTTVRENLFWMPLWVVILLPLVGPIPYGLVAMVAGRWRTVTAPLCARHRLHWRGRTWIIITLIAAALLGLVTACVWAAIQFERGVRGDAIDTIAALGFVPLLLCMVLAVVIRTTAIHAVAIGDEYMKLAGVSPAFSEALNAMRAAELAESRATGSTEAIA